MIHIVYDDKICYFPSHLQKVFCELLNGFILIIRPVYLKRNKRMCRVVNIIRSLLLDYSLGVDKKYKLSNYYNIRIITTLILQRGIVVKY